jgi:hypothetical protein
MKTLQLAFSRKNTNFQAKHIPHTCQDAVMLSLPPPFFAISPTKRFWLAPGVALDKSASVLQKKLRNLRLALKKTRFFRTKLLCY